MSCPDFGSGLTGSFLIATGYANNLSFRSCRIPNVHPYILYDVWRVERLQLFSFLIQQPLKSHFQSLCPATPNRWHNFLFVKNQKLLFMNMEIYSHGNSKLAPTRRFTCVGARLRGRGFLDGLVNWAFSRRKGTRLKEEKMQGQYQRQLLVRSWNSSKIGECQLERANYFILTKLLVCQYGIIADKMRRLSRYYSAEKMGGLDKMLLLRCCGLPGHLNMKYLFITHSYALPKRIKDNTRRPSSEPKETVKISIGDLCH